MFITWCWISFEWWMVVRGSVVSSLDNDLWCFILDIGWVLDTVCCILIAWCSMFNAWCLMLNAQWLMLDGCALEWVAWTGSLITRGSGVGSGGGAAAAAAAGGGESTAAPDNIAAATSLFQPFLTPHLFVFNLNEGWVNLQVEVVWQNGNGAKYLCWQYWFLVLFDVKQQLLRWVFI